MADDAGVWSSTEARPSQADGDLPSVMDVLVETFEDCREHFVGYLLSGLGVTLTMIPVAFVAVFAVIAAMALGAVPGVMMENEDLVGIGVLLGYIVGFGVLFVVTIMIAPPLRASVGRAVLSRITLKSELAIGDAFGTWRTDMWKVIGTQLLLSFLIFVGAMFCYFPALIVVFLVGFAMPAVIVHRLGPVEAVQLSMNHAMAHPGWHLGFFGVSFGIGLALAYVPFIGPALTVTFLQSFQLRCYTAIFGVDPEPKGWPA